MKVAASSSTYVRSARKFKIKAISVDFVFLSEILPFGRCAVEVVIVDYNARDICLQCQRFVPPLTAYTPRLSPLG